MLPISELGRVERIVSVYKLVNSLTKHNFRFTINGNVHGRLMRRNSHIHIFNQHSINNSTNAALSIALSEYNAIDSATRQLTNLREFKTKVKLKIMNDSKEFSAISTSYFIN